MKEILKEKMIITENMKIDKNKMNKREMQKKLVFVLASALLLIMFSLLISADTFGGSIDLNLTINETGNSSMNNTNNNSGSYTNTTNITYSGTVAYLTKNIANPVIVNAFHEINLDIKVIKDKEISNSRLEEYNTIFIDDVILKNINKINLKNYKIISINRNYGKELELTDRDGLSQRSSNGKLKVNKNGSVINVYIEEFFNSNKLGVPYYYISKNNEIKNSNMTYVASVSNGNQDVGSVIAYSNSGNGKCFFGIAKAKYWTDDSKELFKECVKLTYSTNVSVNSTIQ